LLRRLVVARDPLPETGVLHLGLARTAAAALDLVLAA
jgi:hypothetical protein